VITSECITDFFIPSI